MTDEQELAGIARGLAGDDPTPAASAADVETPEVPDWLIPDHVYDVLKWAGLVVLPALGVLVQTLGPVWGWTWADAAATTLDAIGLAVGVVIGASALNARRFTIK